jgi:Ni/Co efflux regulator RcnB
MKKLALALVTLSTLVATPVFACPMEDHAKETADQTKKDDAAKTADKNQNQKPTEKAADKAKDSKPAPAKPVAKG